MASLAQPMTKMHLYTNRKKKKMADPIPHGHTRKVCFNNYEHSKSETLTHSIGHTVKENPPVLLSCEAHVVTGLNTDHR